MIVAAIDIGTNTVLLLIAQIGDGGTVTPLLYEQRVPRLGRGVDAEKNLKRESMLRAIDVLVEYKQVMASFAPDSVVVGATSAVRDAQNRDEFAELVRRLAGFDLEVLSGNDEAYWTYRGAISGIPDVHRATVVDIGGGSTEIITGNAHEVSQRSSLNVGSVRMTERFFKHDPPLESEIQEATMWLTGELKAAGEFSFEGSTLVGVAGTATSLAILDQELHEFRIEAIINYRLTLKRVQALVNKLKKMTSSQILNLSNVMHGRNDVITAGAIILLEIMTQHGFDEVIVSERGVRYGLALREWEKTMANQTGRLA
jgi:exopolyphosphatase/guanosine-5'-triphosphate,3'-diphosphate pyrophosphatase